MANIADLIADKRILRIAARKLQDALVNIPASRQAKLNAHPDHDQYDLGYQTCIDEINLRIGEVLDEVGNLLAERNIQLPTDEELAPPIMISVRVGNSGAPNYDTIYGDVPSKWNDVQIGQFYQTLGGAVGEIVGKDRVNRSITIRWLNQLNPEDRIETIEAGSYRLEDPGAFFQVKRQKRSGTWVEVVEKK